MGTVLTVWDDVGDLDISGPAVMDSGIRDADSRSVWYATLRGTFETTNRDNRQTSWGCQVLPKKSTHERFH
jgi:hypothetical protein